MLNLSELISKLPSSQSFEDIIKSHQIYVDKTDLIYKLACDRKPKFLSRPRRFGKSTIVSTLEELFTHGVKPYLDENGNMQESCFKGLAIENLWKDEGQYKVIHIDFSSNPFNFYNFINNVRIDLSEKRITAEIYAIFYNYCFCQRLYKIAKNINITLDLNQNYEALSMFEELIEKIGKRNVVLLVDEYDFDLTHFPKELPEEEHQKYLDIVSSSLK